MKISKDLYYSLVSTENLRDKVVSWRWHPGLGNLGQKCLNLPHLWCHLQKAKIENLPINTLRVGVRYIRTSISALKTAVFGCFTNTLAPLPIAQESCSMAQTANGSASLLDCTRKKLLVGGADFLWVTSLSEVALGSFWLMLPDLGPNLYPKYFAEVFIGYGSGTQVTEAPLQHFTNTLKWWFVIWSDSRAVVSFHCCITIAVVRLLNMIRKSSVCNNAC